MIGLVLSFLIGFGVLRLLSGKNVFRPLDFFLSLGLGVGIASQVMFYAILMGGQHKHEVLVFLTFIIIFFLGALFLKKKPSFHCEPFTPSIISFLILLLPLGIVQIFIYLNKPWGDWDAWSLWNFRANFLFRSLSDWLPIYHHVVQGKHPWLLPHYIAWGWFWDGNETTWVPAVTAFLMSCATLGLVVYALASSVGRRPALLAGLYLISIPYFNWHAASQYASIFLAFFLLGSLVALREYLKEPSLKYAALAGAYFAFLANTKDEGVVLVVLMALLLYTFFKKQHKDHQKCFLSVFISLIGMFILTEIFMRSSLGIPFVEGKYYGWDAAMIFDTRRWQGLVEYVWQNVVFHPSMGGLFFLLLLFALSKADNQGWPFKLGRLQGAFLKVIGLFFIVFSFLYIFVTTNLEWRMMVTVHRVFFIFLPTLVYLIFGVLYKNEEW
ncbi:MAG: glycosyltransferase family 39 protein [Candidatus Omnitrophica bacterium]|nr:glycosyltransferase family 39 protein [Candidatus Omnitrophota bacterium]